MVARLDNWPILLSNYLSERRDMPFAWGTNDCLSFVSGAVHAITGVNFQDEYLPYSDEKTAAELLDLLHGVERIISNHIGHTGSRNILRAKRGDIVVAKVPDMTCGIVDDSGQYFCVVTKIGLARHPIAKAWRFWSY